MDAATLHRHPPPQPPRGLFPLDQKHTEMRRSSRQPQDPRAGLSHGPGSLAGRQDDDDNCNHFRRFCDRECRRDGGGRHMPLSKVSPAQEAPSGAWDGDDSTAKAAESQPGEAGWILSPEKPPTSFPCWPKQTQAKQHLPPRAQAPPWMPGSGHPRWQPKAPAAFLTLPWSPVALPRTREASDSLMHPKKSALTGLMMESPMASSPASPSQQLSTLMAALGHPSSRAMKRKKGFLPLSEESPPHRRSRQCSCRPQRPRAACSAPPRNDAYPCGMKSRQQRPCIRRRPHAARLAEMLGSRNRAPSSPKTPALGSRHL